MKRISTGLLACLVSLHTLSAHAQEPGEDVAELDTYVTEEEITDNLNILQTEPVDSVFGFKKTILDTPRSISSMSSEFLDQFDATSINDIVNFVPGTFTTSFFGVAGSLDIRGTSAENYFRGVKRLNNEGNYPTAIGASDRVDVIRGPMSPISGPGKVGGALNFIPKSARAETGQYLSEPSGAIGYTLGSWDKSVLTAEVGGPTEIMGKPSGFYIYAEVEESESYYNNDFTDQTILQASFNTDLSDTVRIEFGGMYQDWSGHENGGWNRVTQDLIDNGTYITGQPAVNIDTDFGNGNGLVQEAEIDAFEASLLGLASTGTPFSDGEITCFTGISAFCFEGNFNNLDTSLLTQDFVDSLGIGLDPATVGTAKLKGSQVLIGLNDVYDTEVYAFYFDVINEMDNGWTMTNKVFYDSQEYTNVDSYGFTKIADAWVIEDQLIFASAFEFDGWSSAVQISPSIRYTDAFYALDFSDEIFDRPDLTVGYNSSSTQSAPSLLPVGAESWSDYTNSTYVQYGFSVMTDTMIGENLNAVIGARFDYVDVEAENGDGAGPVVLRSLGIGEAKASDTDSGVTWTASLSYALPGGIKPYITAAEQTTIISGSAGDISVDNVAGSTFLGDSELLEVGIKASLLDGRLYTAIAAFEQERIDFQSQSPVNNQPTITDGIEFEFRYVPIDALAIIGTFSKAETKVITGGSTFSYIGAADMPNIDPASVYGGIIGGNLAVANETLRGGIPETTWSLSASYKWIETFSTSVNVTYVDETASSVLGGIILPDYTLVNISGSFENDSFKAGLYLNNVTNEEYFRGNFPSLYGNNAVLPELPFNWTAKFAYKF